MKLNFTLKSQEARMLDRLLFILSEAGVSLKRNFGMVILSVLTTAVCLYVLGGLGLLYLGIQKGAQGMTGALEMRVYLKEGTTRDQVTTMLKDVRAIPGVEKALLIPKENAWAKFSKENPEIAKDIDNPYPDGLKIILNDLSRGDSLAAEMRARPETEPENGVNYLKKEQTLLEQALKLLRWVGATAGGMLLLVAGVLIFTVTRLAAMSRRIEIRIMRLVGAGYSTMYLPMVIEGKVQGVLGGLLAASLLQLTYRQVSHVVASYASIPPLPPFPLQPVYLWMVIAGASYGITCSCLALIRLHKRIR
jgi:cell division transport system permease protein